MGRKKAKVRQHPTQQIIGEILEQHRRCGSASYAGICQGSLRRSCGQPYPLPTGTSVPLRLLVGYPANPFRQATVRMSGMGEEHPFCRGERKGRLAGQPASDRAAWARFTSWAKPALSLAATSASIFRLSLPPRAID